MEDKDPFVMSWQGNTFPITDPLWGETTGHKGLVIRGYTFFSVVSLDTLLNKQRSYR